MPSRCLVHWQCGRLAGNPKLQSYGVYPLKAKGMLPWCSKPYGSSVSGQMAIGQILHHLVLPGSYFPSGANFLTFQSTKCIRTFKAKPPFVCLLVLNMQPKKRHRINDNFASLDRLALHGFMRMSISPSLKGVSQIWRIDQRENEVSER